MKKNIIFSLVTSTYPLKDFKPFVETLRKTNFEGDVVFFVNNLPKKTKNYFQSKKIKLIPFSFDYPYLKGNKTIIGKFKDFKNVKLNVFHLREFLPLVFLSENKNKYNLGILSDSADVIFQRDPFEDKFDPKKIYFPLQDNKIKDSKRDMVWIEDIYGKSELNKIKENNISCTGTIVGGVKPLINYLKLLINEFKKGETIDQGNHNYLVYSNKIKNQVLLKNSEGIFLTCSGFKKNDFSLNKNKKIMTSSKKIFSMVHQYDTSPYWSFLQRGVSKRSIREFAKRLPLFGRFFIELKALFIKSYVHIDKK